MLYFKFVVLPGIAETQGEVVNFVTRLYSVEYSFLFP